MLRSGTEHIEIVSKPLGTPPSFSGGDRKPGVQLLNLVFLDEGGDEDTTGTIEQRKLASPYQQWLSSLHRHGRPRRRWFTEQVEGCCRGER